MVVIHNAKVPAPSGFMRVLLAVVCLFRLLHQMVFLLDSIGDVIEDAESHEELRNSSQVVAVSGVKSQFAVEFDLSGEDAATVPAQLFAARPRACR